jgi:hypothetical protein
LVAGEILHTFCSRCVLYLVAIEAKEATYYEECVLWLMNL